MPLNHLSKEKQLIVKGAIRFLKTGLDPDKFLTNRRPYQFFTETLSMPAMSHPGMFAAIHFENDQTKAAFLAQVREEINMRIMLDPERHSDIASLFIPAGYGYEPGPYADLLNPTTPPPRKDQE